MTSDSTNKENLGTLHAPDAAVDRGLRMGWSWCGGGGSRQRAS